MPGRRAGLRRRSRRLLRLTRGGMIDAMRADYVRTARAKGLRRASIVLKHALRNAAMPVVAIVRRAARLHPRRLGRDRGRFQPPRRRLPRLGVDPEERLPGRCRPSCCSSRVTVRRAHPAVRPAERRARSAAADGHDAPHRACRWPLRQRRHRRRDRRLRSRIVRAAAGAARPVRAEPLGAPLPPSWMEGGSPAHLLGTDQLGRDYLSRLILGARISMMIGVLTVMMSGIIGTTLGAARRLFRRPVDRVVMFVVPAGCRSRCILVALTVSRMVGSSLLVVMLTLGLLLWERFAVVARAATKQVAQPRLRGRRLGRRLFAPAHHPAARSCPTSRTISSSSPPSTWRSPSCSRRRCPSSASACRRRCRPGG